MRLAARVLFLLAAGVLVTLAVPAQAGGIVTETYYFSDCAAQNQVGYEWKDHDGGYYSEGTLDGEWKEVVRTDPETYSILSDKFYVWCSGANGFWWERPSLGGYCCAI